ncbi:MAG: hypothetical protein V3T99_00970 [Nitrososphaerales archaeon]
MDTLLLDRGAVRSLVSIDEVIAEVKRSFIEKSRGRIQMPSKPYLFFPEYGGDLRVMPSYMDGAKLAAVKIVNSHTRNKEKGLPGVMATVTLIDPETGEPLCIMDGTLITILRTAAASAVATEALARNDSSTLGIVGTGAESEPHVLALSKVMKIERVLVYGRSKEGVEGFITRVRSSLDIEVEYAPLEKVVAGSDVLVTLTPVRSPIVMNHWVKDGIHVNAVGADAPGKQELEVSTLKRAKVIVDDWDQSSHGGEINRAIEEDAIKKEDIHGELGDVLINKIPGRVSNNEVTVFDSTGLAIQDLATASIVYKKAIKEGIGSKFAFIG